MGDEYAYLIDIDDFWEAAMNSGSKTAEISIFNDSCFSLERVQLKYE